MIGKLIFWIFITLISLAFLGYIVARDVPDIQEKSKELDKAKQEEQQALREVKKAYDECRTSNSKSECDAIVADDPKADEIIHD
jgi:beta-lactam-binding protein with PASTA domain